MLDEAMADASAALSIDPVSVIALGALASCRWQRLHLVSGVEAVVEWQDGISAANRAIEADRNDCLGYAYKAMLLAFAPGSDRVDDALANARRAYELNPHNITALLLLAFVEAIGGLTTEALDHLKQVLRLSPATPFATACATSSP